MAWVTIKVGREKEIDIWVPVVPDSYLTAEVLLGTDVITESDLTWRSKQRTIEWGNQIYPVALIRTKRNTVSNVTRGDLRESREKQSKGNKLKHKTSLHLKRTLRIAGETTCVFPFKINESPSTCILLEAQGQGKNVTIPMVFKVNNEQTIYVPIVNE